MAYEEMSDANLKKAWPELGGGANRAPLEMLYGVLDIVSACLTKADGTSYNPEGLNAGNFTWAHVRLSDAGGPTGYPTQSQLVACSDFTQKVQSSDIMLALKHDCQTYMIELSNLSKV